MSYTPYIVEGELKNKLAALLRESENITNKRIEYAKSIGANSDTYVIQGPHVVGFFFDNPDDKPDRWVWNKNPIWDGREQRRDYASPQRRSKADKAEWAEIAKLSDQIQMKLKKLFYNDIWGYKSGTKRLGVGYVYSKDQYYVEIATKSQPLKGMREILRSEYDQARG